MMSQSNSSKTTIKIAAKEASQRNPGGADPGPGDLSAAPSVAPQLVEIPAPPTSSQLVVKSTASRQTTATNLPTLNEARSGTAPSTRALGPKSIIQASMSAAHASGAGAGKPGSQAGASSHPPHSASGGAPREPTSSRQLTGVPGTSLGSQPAGPKSVASSGAVKSVSGPKSSSGPPLSAGASGSAATTTGTPVSSAGAGAGAGGPTSADGAPRSGTSIGAGPSFAGGAPKSGPQSASSPVTASTAMQADSGVVHDEDEEGEGELEHPDTEVSPTGGGGGGGPSSPGAPVATSQKSATVAKSVSHQHDKSSASSGTGGGGIDSSLLDDMKSGPSGKGKKNKVTKFRYHKRIVVRTKGNANPSTIMDKVNKKAGNARITPSTIEDMDPQELMKRAGIKGSNKTHWRVRLRQTKRLTKNGKTTTQTKVAYRDSEGNKRVKTSLSPFCKTCGKKLEECKCESNSES